jgi:hypothetical protein
LLYSSRNEKSKFSLSNFSNISSKSSSGTIISQKIDSPRSYQNIFSSSSPTLSPNQQNIPISNDLNFWKMISDFSSTLFFQKEDVILEEGIKDDNLYFIKKGSCKMAKSSKDRTVEIQNLPSGSFLGVKSCLLDCLTPSKVVCLEDCEIMSFNKNDLLILFKRSSFLATRLFKILLDSLCEQLIGLFAKNQLQINEN